MPLSLVHPSRRSPPPGCLDRLFWLAAISEYSGPPMWVTSINSPSPLSPPSALVGQASHRVAHDSTGEPGRSYCTASSMPRLSWRLASLIANLHRDKQRFDASPCRPRPRMTCSTFPKPDRCNAERQGSADPRPARPLIRPTCHAASPAHFPSDSVARHYYFLFCQRVPRTQMHRSNSRGKVNPAKKGFSAEANPSLAISLA